MASNLAMDFLRQPAGGRFPVTGLPRWAQEAVVSRDPGRICGHAAKQPARLGIVRRPSDRFSTVVRHRCAEPRLPPSRRPVVGREPPTRLSARQMPDRQRFRGRRGIWGAMKRVRGDQPAMPQTDSTIGRFAMRCWPSGALHAGRRRTPARSSSPDLDRCGPSPRRSYCRPRTDPRSPSRPHEALGHRHR